MVSKLNIKEVINKFVFQSESDYKINLIKTEDKDDILKILIKISFEEKIVPLPVIIKWTYPCKNVYSQWNPALWSDRTLNTNWMPIKNASRSTESVPVQTHLSLDGKNKITVSLSDTLTPIEIATGIIEETAEISYKLTLFTKRISPISEYEAVLTIDTRNISYIDVLYETNKQWRCEKINTPQACKEPMYSTWYSYHQNLVHEELIEELRLAKKMGMEAVIIDDGWQTEDGKRGYSYCGDWNPVKIPDMRKFVEDVHDVGMKCIVWFGVPFVGIHSKAWNRFEDKFLNSFDEKHPWCVLDPRYPEVREYLINIYWNAVTEWNIDGLKLDFINNMQLTETSAVPNEYMDYDSLEEAICALLRETNKHLRTINPDILIEFRQPYIGPIMCQYGNMLRVADCPMDAQKNRAGIVDLRLLSGENAVHSDMVMWNYEDIPESAAIQLINIMFGVPQISVLIEKLSLEHKRVLEFFLSFWKNNKKCLLDGKLNAENPEAGYSIVTSETDESLIAVSYIKNILNAKQKYKKIVFINGSWEKELFINNHFSAYDAKYKIYDCMGNVVECGNTIINEGINAFKVPNSGMIEIYVD